MAVVVVTHTLAEAVDSIRFLRAVCVPMSKKCD